MDKSGKNNRQEADLKYDPAKLAQEARLASLEATGLMDSPRNIDFDKLTEMTAGLLNCPISVVNLIGKDRQFSVSFHGAEVPDAERDVPLTDSICKYVAASGKELVIERAMDHEEFRVMHSVQKLDVQSYAGFPLWAADGQALGALCVVDHKPRSWTEGEMSLLHQLASVASDCINAAELRNRLQNTAPLD